MEKVRPCYGQASDQKSQIIHTPRMFGAPIGISPRCLPSEKSRWLGYLVTLFA